MNKRNMVLSVILGSILIAGVFSATYAYFAINQSNTSSNVTIVTGNTTLVLDDVDPITREDQISPNYTSITRYLTIRNEGSVDGYAKLLFKDLVNTFVLDDLTYTLEEVNSDKTSLSTPNIIVDNEIVPKSSTASNIELADGLLIPSNTSKYYKLTVSYDYKNDINQDVDLNKVLTSGFIIEEGSKPINNIYCVDVSNNEIDCPNTFIQGDRIAIGRETPQYFRYLRTTSTSTQLAECGTTSSVACADSENGNLKFLAEYNLKRTAKVNNSTAIASDALQDPSDITNANSVSFGASSNYNKSYVKIYINNYASILNAMIEEADVIKVNLISLPEIRNLGWGCPVSSSGSCDNVPTWAKNSSYWFSSAYSATHIWCLTDYPEINSTIYYSLDYRGVRPVIEFSPNILN